MLTNDAKAFIHAQQYGMVKKTGAKVNNPFKQFQMKGKKSGRKENK